MEGKINTIFVDMDGTLIHTDIANNKAYACAINEVIGEELPEDIFLSRMTSEYLDTMFPYLSVMEHRRIKSIKDARYNEYLELTQVNSRLVNYLMRHYRKRIVLVSRANGKRVMDTLAYHGLLHIFDSLFCAEDSKDCNKYETALSGLALNPRDIIVFENEEIEIQNAICIDISGDNIVKIGA